MKPLNIVLMILLLIAAGTFLGLFSNNSGIKKISPEDAKKNMENNPEIVLLDVRTVEEYREINIPGSLLIPLHELENTVEEKIPEKNRIIYVYCRTGNRSVTAVNILLKLGYDNVYDLGGINSWPYEKVSLN